MASAILLRRIRGAVCVGKRASQKDIVAVRIRPDLASAQLVTAIRHFNDRTALFEIVRKWAFDDLLSDKRFVVSPSGERLYLADFQRRVDVVFEFDRNRLLHEYVNPNTLPRHRLTEAERRALREAFSAGPLMIR